MAITLNHEAVKRAKYIIQAGEVETMGTDWQEEMPTPSELEIYIDNHNMEEYGSWFLGKNDEFPKNVKEHYEYPYGDLKEVQRCALVYSLEKAKKNNDIEIVQAAKELLELVDEQ